MNEKGKTIGSVTTGTQSSSLQKATGMGNVSMGHSMIDAEIYIA